MIQTKFPITVHDRNQIKSILKIEVRPSTEKIDNGQKYLVIDWRIDNLDSAKFSKEIIWSTEQVNAMNLYIEENYDLSGLTRVEAENRKYQIALMMDTQTNLLEDGKTIYGLNPEDWEFSVL